MRHVAKPRLLAFFPLSAYQFPEILSRSILKIYYHRQTHVKENQPSNELLDSFDHLLQQCATVQQCKQIHTHIIVTGCCGFAFLAATVVRSYARFGCLFDAHKVFDTTPFECISNLLLWNAIMRVNVAKEHHEDAFKLYVKMRRLGVLGDGYTFPLVIKACTYVASSSLCRIVHGHVLGMGFQNNLYVANELIGMYSKLGRIKDARNVFERMGVRNCISWNMMVSAYSFNCDCNGSLEIFRRMQSEGLEPNLVTWTSLMSSHARSGRLGETLQLFGVMRTGGIDVSAEVLAVVLSVCAGLGVFDKGKVIHGYVIKGGFEDYSFVKTALICVYGKNADLNGAKNLFLEMKNKSIASWNALITSHSEAGLCDEALEIFLQLERSKDCLMLRPNLVTWTAVIDGFASKGRGEESLEIFRRMQLAKVLANSVTISTVLSVCAELAALHLGREIHGHVIRALMNKNILVENGLVNMYTKCGCLKEGHDVFEKIESKDLVSWNSMIAGYGMHGLGVNALETFNQMIISGFKPDGVTFVAILSACSHAGLVSEGRSLFDQMLRKYMIEPKMEHYACMVDLLGRAGLLQEASEIVKNMPVEPNACVWGALLNSCRMHNNADVAEETASHMFSLNLQETTGNYMLLSNVYAAGGRWEDSARVRTSARRKGLKKNRGQSWIKVKKDVHMFSAGKNMEMGLEQVIRILEELALQMETEGYIHANNIIPQDVDT